MLWGGMANGLMQLIGAVFGLVLLRYLTPEDYGKVAMLNIFAAIASALQESGFIAALCNKKEPTHEEYNAVFWFNLLVSAALYIILWFCAPLIARFYGDDDLIPLSRVLFLGFLFSGLGTVQRAYLFGHLMVKQTSICSLTAILLSSIIGVVMAINDFASWAIVTQAICFVLITQVMSWFFSPWRPTAPLCLPHEGEDAKWQGGKRKPPITERIGGVLAPAWKMFGFSSKLMLTNIVNICNLHAFSVLLGKCFNEHTAGIYSQAKGWNDKASSTINGMVTGVAQPTLAQVAEDLGRYRQVFRKMLRFICFVSFPAMLGLGLVAQEFILLAGGEKWRESGLILSLLCIHGAFVPITTLYSNLTISRGKSGVNMGCTIGQCIAVWAGLILLYPYGLIPMVIYFVALNISWLSIWQWWAWRLTGLTFIEALKDIVPFLVFTLVVLGVTWWLTNGITNLWLLLISRILIAAVLYGGIMWVSGAKIMREAIQYIIKKR